MKSWLRKMSLTLTVATFLSVFYITQATGNTFEAAETALENITVGWNLGNSLDSCGDWIKLYTKGESADYEKAWGNPVTTKALITAVKDAGFNAVRIPVTWDAHIDSNGNIDKEWLNRVQTVVDYVVSQNMYCILNVHHDAGSDGWLIASAGGFKGAAKRYEGLWKNISECFKNYDNKLIFESFNEMLDKNDDWSKTNNEGYKALNDFNQLFVTTVRKTGGNNASRNLILQTYASNGTEEINLSNFKMPVDTAVGHMIVEVHNYDPQGFTFADAAWTVVTDKWGTAAEKKYINELFENLSKYAKKWNTPIIVGEFAAEYKNNDNERAKYAKHYVQSAKKYGIKCFWWDTGGMALFDRENCEITHKMVIDALVK